MWSTWVLIFLGAWFGGFFLEYVLHWIMHRFTLGFHIGHHKEFFHLEPKAVALRTIDPRLDIKFFLGALLLVSPIMYFWQWEPVLLIWGGLFWHIVIFYEMCHAIMHHDKWLPKFISGSRLFRWWKGCHFEHHFHSPAKNYCVTMPLVDVLFGTYIKPRSNYAELPHPKFKPEGEEYVVEEE